MSAARLCPGKTPWTLRVQNPPAPFPPLGVHRPLPASCAAPPGRGLPRCSFCLKAMRAESPESPFKKANNMGVAFFCEPVQQLEDFAASDKMNSFFYALDALELPAQEKLFSAINCDVSLTKNLAATQVITLRAVVTTMTTPRLPTRRTLP